MWGAYICAISPPAAVEILKQQSERDYLAHRKGKPQTKTTDERFIEDVVALNHDAYCMCLGRCFLWTLDSCGASREDPVHVLVAHQPKRAAKIAFVYSMAAHNPRWSDLLSGLSHGPEMNPRVIRPLQVADFVAYYLAKSQRNRADKRAAQALKTLQPHFVGICDALSVTDGWTR